MNFANHTAYKRVPGFRLVLTLLANLAVSAAALLRVNDSVEIDLVAAGNVTKAATVSSAQ